MQGLKKKLEFQLALGTSSSWIFLALDRSQFALLHNDLVGRQLRMKCTCPDGEKDGYCTPPSWLRGWGRTLFSLYGFVLCYPACKPWHVYCTCIGFIKASNIHCIIHHLDLQLYSFVVTMYPRNTASNSRVEQIRRLWKGLTKATNRVVIKFWIT